jgi:para-nitrobenzyl esterase
LNVYTPIAHERRPNRKRGSKRPVMVWIPGGGLFIGGSTGYDRSALVNEGDVVFVSMNYRLNAFGFFSHPAINQP